MSVVLIHYQAAARDSETAASRIDDVHLFVRLSVCLFVCQSPKCKNAIFWKLSNLVSSNWVFKASIIGSLKSKMAEIRHLENRHDVIFFCRGWFDLDKTSETGAE